MVSNASKRVMIVDDQSIVAETTRRMLQTTLPAVEIIVQTSSEEAIELLRETPVAVLLCDLQMPVYDGVDVMKAAHEMDPAVVSILVTAFATKESVMRAINEGNTWRCIEKPWDSSEVADLVVEGMELYAERIAASTATALPSAPAPEPQRKPAPKRIASPERAPASRPAGKGKLIIHKNKPRKKLVPKKRGAAAAPSPEKKVRYQNMVLVKRGGTGSIYRADDTLLGIPVAIKVLSESVMKDEGAMVMLLDEARIAMGLSHKHIVRLHNIEELHGTYHLVMEYIEGSTFRDILNESTQLPLDMVVQIVGICEDALGYAHRRKAYHRDLKPDNFMLAEDGVLKIIDFGLACLAEKQRKTDIIEGTPYYISPEEVRGEIFDQRGDIYSLGVMLHEFILGKLPRHAGETLPEDVFDYRPVAAPDLPGDLRNVLQRSFAANPEERWEDIHGFADAFRSALA